MKLLPFNRQEVFAGLDGDGEPIPVVPEQLVGELSLVTGLGEDPITFHSVLSDISERLRVGEHGRY